MCPPEPRDIESDRQQRCTRYCLAVPRLGVMKPPLAVRERPCNEELKAHFVPGRHIRYYALDGDSLGH
jgi:hypothetical protein